jgi:hypothetical protein
MKHLLIIATLLSCRAVAQTSANAEIPNTIKLRFMDEFISAKDVSWKPVRKDQFAATFYHQGQNKKAFYNLADTIVILETTLLSPTQLPPAILKLLTTKYRHYQLESMTQIEGEGDEKFRLMLTKNEKRYEMMLSNTGRIIQRSRY